jgi:hypothetical protein
VVKKYTPPAQVLYVLIKSMHDATTGVKWETRVCPGGAGEIHCSCNNRMSKSMNFSRTLLAKGKQEECDKEAISVPGHCSNFPALRFQRAVVLLATFAFDLT